MKLLLHSKSFDLRRRAGPVPWTCVCMYPRFHSTEPALSRLVWMEDKCTSAVKKRMEQRATLYSTKRCGSRRASLLLCWRWRNPTTSFHGGRILVCKNCLSCSVFDNQSASILLLYLVTDSSRHKRVLCSLLPVTEFALLGLVHAVPSLQCLGTGMCHLLLCFFPM